MQDPPVLEVCTDVDHNPKHGKRLRYNATVRFGAQSHVDLGAEKPASRSAMAADRQSNKINLQGADARFCGPSREYELAGTIIAATRSD